MVTLVACTPWPVQVPCVDPPTSALPTSYQQPQRTAHRHRHSPKVRWQCLRLSLQQPVADLAQFYPWVVGIESCRYSVSRSDRRANRWSTKYINPCFFTLISRPACGPASNELGHEHYLGMVE